MLRTLLTIIFSILYFILLMEDSYHNLYTSDLFFSFVFIIWAGWISSEIILITKLNIASRKGEVFSSKHSKYVYYFVYLALLLIFLFVIIEGGVNKYNQKTDKQRAEDKAHSDAIKNYDKDKINYQSEDTNIYFTLYKNDMISPIPCDTDMDCTSKNGEEAHVTSYVCQSGNCSSHLVGYKWAKAKEIDYPDKCPQEESSFSEGCKAYVERFYPDNAKQDYIIDEDYYSTCFNRFNC